MHAARRPVIQRLDDKRLPAAYVRNRPQLALAIIESLFFMFGQTSTQAAGDAFSFGTTGLEGEDDRGIHQGPAAMRMPRTRKTQPTRPAMKTTRIHGLRRMISP